MRTAPLAVSNTGNTVVTTPDGKAIRARLDPVRNAGVRSTVCGDGLLRLMAVALEPTVTKREILDLACGADRWLDESAQARRDARRLGVVAGQPARAGRLR
ncbi:hypothetical protein G5V59_07395 [Nocardioides sp. W3-2-3]|uniref:hypothetical protein n=1 Tax=Nocardioides convexus TaxID=2712224 RepID=UPI002418958D|nr:hypothetical protein [Nocardioides convexus]NHA00069.1 hypothetical protein [Nocardioides convexus]